MLYLSPLALSNHAWTLLLSFLVLVSSRFNYSTPPSNQWWQWKPSHLFSLQAGDTEAWACEFRSRLFVNSNFNKPDFWIKSPVWERKPLPGVRASRLLYFTLSRPVGRHEISQVFSSSPALQLLWQLKKEVYGKSSKSKSKTEVAALIGFHEMRMWMQESRTLCLKWKQSRKQEKQAIQAIAC